MLKRGNVNEKRWRALQASQSSAHRNGLRKYHLLRCLFLAIVLMFMVTAVIMFKRMNAFHETNVIINYHRAPRQGFSGEPAKENNDVYGGVSLDSIGNLVLKNPVHKLCDTKLFFIERAEQISLLTGVLQAGTVLSRESNKELLECCSSCSSQVCDGFRFVGGSCTLLTFPHIEVEEEEESDTEVSIKEEEDGTGTHDRGFHLSVSKDQDSTEPETPYEESTDDKPTTQIPENEESIIDLEGDSSSTGKQALRSQSEFEEELDKIVEEAVQGSTSQSVASEGEEEDSLSLDFESFDSSFSSEDHTGDSIQTLGEKTKQEEKGGDVFGEMEFDLEPSTTNNNEVGNNEMAADIEWSSEEDSSNNHNDDSSLSESEETANEFGMNVMSKLPDELQAIDHSGEAEQLRDFLGVSDNSNDLISKDSDQELMKELMDQINNRHNPKKDDANDEGMAAERQKVVLKSTEEDRFSNEENLEISQQNINQIIPLGDYQRLTARDQFYMKNKNLVLRYRTNRELTAVAQSMAESFNDVEYITFGKSGDKKKPQYLRSLRVGNGRRGKHVFVVATLRGCEWTSALATLHTALALKGRGTTTKSLLDAVQFHFIPIVNPDGFDYSHHKSPSNARSWCKNRRVAVSGYHGVDLEHNWGLDGVSWGFGKRDAAGAKLDVFQGPSNFSEPETRSLRDYMLHYASGRGRVALLYVKCCGASITPPQVYKTDIPNPVNVNHLVQVMAKQIERTDGSKYTVVQRETTFHAKNQGQMIDWAYNEANIDNAFTLEVKGLGLSTRADHAKISVEPFQTLLRELETATVFIALRLLSQPVEGEAVNVPFKYSGGGSLEDSGSATSSASSSSSSAASKKKKKKTT